MQLLYRIERFARNMELSHEQRKELRLDHALSVLNRLGKWMADNYGEYLTKSPMKEALDYTIRRWDNLMEYLSDGALEIHNNLVENSIRPNALGRINYLLPDLMMGQSGLPCGIHFSAYVQSIILIHTDG